ncbi:MAG: hypothetical protein ACRD5M_08805 [Candidatus Acidiferrales bacterium]
MKRYGILSLATLALAISTGAQGTSSNQSGVSAGAQANANASASASVAQEKQTPSQTHGSRQSSASSSASASHSGSASASAGNKSLNLADDSAIQAKLLSTLDARHSKPGDEVVARTTQDVKQDGHVVMHKGTKLMGHVTEAQARTKQNGESAIGLVFDKAIMKGGQEVPVHLGIQALAAAATESSASLADSGPMMATGGAAGAGRASGGGLLGGSGAAVGGVTGAAGGVAGNLGQTTNGAVGAAAHSATSAAGSAGGLNATGQLTSASRGVFGLEGLSLTSAAANTTQGSVVSSTSRNVHLDSGTQMVLQVAKQ